MVFLYYVNKFIEGLVTEDMEGNQMRYQIIEEHKTDNNIPINVKKGETVKVGRKSFEEDGWENWIYCYSLDSHSEGWTPVQIVQIENEYGTILSDYSANELNVSKNDIVHGELELNGWLWCCRIGDSEWGWIPKEKIMTL